MSKPVVRLLLVLSFLALVMTVALPQAEAACFTPHSHTTTYYAWLNNGSNTFYSCSYVIISPPLENYAHFGVIGETTIECDNSVTSWGDTTTCTGSYNTEHSSQACERICE
jgi:hypothetical protein